MRIINNSQYNLSHGDYVCKIGEKLEVPEEVAKKWFNIKGVEEYISPVDIEKAKKEAVEAALKEYKEKEAKKVKCAECYADDKTPAEQDCKKCKTVKKTVKKSTKK